MAPMSPNLSLETLARRPAWPLAEVLTLEGRCKASLMRDWGVHVARRFGPEAPQRLRDELGLDARRLPDSPDVEGWVPVAWQCALTRLIVLRHLGGDVLAMEPMLREDARRRPQRLVDKVLKLAISPRKILSASPKIHAGIFDRGQCVAEVSRHEALITWRGARYFAEPTWRVMQLFAARALFDALDEPAPECLGEDLGADAFRLALRW